MAKKIFNRRVLALLLALVMCFSTLRVTAQAAPAGRWSYNFYLCHEYLGNAAGAAVKPDPLGYGFQGVFTNIVFTDDDGVTWTFNWNTAQNGDWKASGSGVSEATAKRFPATTDGKVYYGTCGGRAYAFTITTEDVPDSWTWVSDSSRATNWCGYIRFIREYTVNVFYQNETGSVNFNGERFAAEEPLVRSFNFKYPDDGQIADSENEDSDYTSPTKLLPSEYLPQTMKDLGYEIKYATDAQGNDVLVSGVTISLLGENVLNVYCTLIPPKTENYTVLHSYYTEGSHDGTHNGGTVEVEENADFAQVVDGIAKETVYNGNTYGYVSYAVDAADKVITLTYTRQLPTYNYSVIYNANFGAAPATKADSDNVSGTKATTHNIGVDANSFIRENYTFIGWNTQPDGSGTTYAAGDTVQLTTEKNAVTLYAQWAEYPKYSYEVVYNANFGATPATKADSQNVYQTYAAAHTIGVDPNEFDRSNYTFLGWATSPDGEVVYQPGDAISFTEGGSQTLYAQWAEHPKYDYTVIYNANFGTSPATKADGQNVEQTYAAAYTIGVDANEFVRSNYTFLGWATSPDGEVVYQPGDAISFTEGGTQTLYARWIEHNKYGYSVIYNGNGGTLTGGELSYGDSENISNTYSTSHSVKVDANSFVRVNYVFAGWNTAPDGSGTAYAANETIALTSADNTRTLYAQWVENDKYDYRVVYNANFGETPAVKTDSESVFQTYAVTHKITVDANGFVRDNYTFLGWATAPNGEVVYQAGDMISFAEGGEALLYAVWQENAKYDYKVVYNANFGKAPAVKTDSESISQTYAAAYEISVDANGFVRDNYTFLGWATASNGEVVYQPGDVIAFAEGGEALLYAVWQENAKYDYSVIYNANFGAAPAVRNDGENVTGIYAEEYKITVDSNPFLRENYTFLGWNTKADGSGTAYTAGEAVALTAEKNAATLYAQWSEHPKYDYKVVYNANFGTSPEKKTDVESISGIYATTHSVNVDANSFIRENYTFIGWNTQADGNGTAYAPGSKLNLTAETNEAVLYAQWVENDKFDYALIYNANFGETPATMADSESISQTYALNHTIGVDANSFVRENYTFVGWNIAADGSGTAYAAGETVALTAEKNTATLYAQWVENAKYDYSVTYNANFGEAPATAADSENVAQTYAASYTIGVDANGFVRENYTFLGWAFTPEGEVAIQAGDVISFAEGGSQILYAKWVEHDKYSYTVLYNGNGGALETAAVSYGDSENIVATYAKSAEIQVDTNSFVRENYTFTGWNTAADGTGKAYSAEEALQLTAKDNTVTLYAQWEENAKYDYSVIYEGNFEGAPEAKADAENAEQTYAETYTIGVDPNSFQREGYTFSGWAVAPEGEAVYKEGDTISFTKDGSQTLYAVWTIKEYEYTVEYVVRVDGGEYEKFTGELPEGAPQTGTVPHGTVIDEEYLENLPGSINDGTHTYDFTGMEEITVPYGTNTVIVYYTYISPEPPAPPAEDPANPEPPAPPAPPAQEPAQQNDDGLVDIPDEDVPLADVPKTGDPMFVYVGMTALSGLGLLGLTRKKDEEDEEA